MNGKLLWHLTTFGCGNELGVPRINLAIPFCISGGDIMSERELKRLIYLAIQHRLEKSALYYTNNDGLEIMYQTSNTHKAYYAIAGLPDSAFLKYQLIFKNYPHLPPDEQ